MRGIEFVHYVLSFYGPNGIYDYGFTEDEVVKAVEIHKRSGTVPFEGDSVDREIVRDIVLAQREAV